MKDLLSAKCKYFHQSLDRERWFSLMSSAKQKCSFRTRLKYVEWPLPGVQTVGATLREMRLGKRARGGVGINAYFSRPTLLPRRPTTGSRTKDGRPRLLI